MIVQFTDSPLRGCYSIMPESPDSPGRKGSILGFGSVVFSNTSKCSHGLSTDYKMLFWHAFCSSSLFHSCTKNYWQQTPNHVRLWKIGILSTIILNNLGEFAYRTPFLKVTKSLNVNSATHKWIFEYFLAGRKARIILKLFFTNGYVITDDNIFDEIKKN